MDKFKVHKTLSALTFVLGAILLTLMISFESEPGAIPLLLVTAGAGWYLVTRVRAQSHQEQ